MVRKADLHVHTWHSGWQGIPFIDTLDCYVDPVTAVEVARERGMDYIALTDHDSIGGWKEVRDRRPDLWRHVIPGVELETAIPEWDLRIHLNILGIGERHHEELQALRSSLNEVLRYTQQENLLVILNHPLRSLWRSTHISDFLSLAANRFDHFEVLNSTSPRIANRVTDSWIRSTVPSPCRVGGSDAHTLHRIAGAYTVADGESPEAFLESVKAGRCRPEGEEAGPAAIVADVYRIVGSYYASLGGSMFRGRPGSRLWNLWCALLLIPGSLTMPAFFGSANHAQHALLGWWLDSRRPQVRQPLAPLRELKEGQE